MNRILKIAVMALLAVGLFMACISCTNMKANVGEASSEALTDEVALKTQIEEFPESIYIKGYSGEEGTKFFNTFALNHPEYFWLPSTYSYYETEDGITISMDYPYEVDRLISMKNDLESKVAEVAQIAKTRTTDYERALFVHDYIIENCVYAEDKMSEALADTSGAFYIENTAYGCLLGGEALCGGYSRAYFLIMNKLGQECLLASGDSYEDNIPHGWNIVKMDGEYYHVDVTFDDPVLAEGEGTLKSYTFFGLTDDEIKETRTISEERDLPECTATENNYFVKNGYFLETYEFDSCMEIIKSQFTESGVARVKFGSEEELDKALKDLITNHRIQEIITDGKISYLASGRVITLTR